MTMSTTTPTPRSARPAMVMRPRTVCTRETLLQHAAVMMTQQITDDLDAPTLAKMRQTLQANINDWWERDVKASFACIDLAADQLPPQPLRAAAFSVRFPWSAWWKALSPTDEPVRWRIRDIRGIYPPPPGQQLLARPQQPQQPISVPVRVPAPPPPSFRQPEPFMRSASPSSSLGRSSSCSSMRSILSSETSLSSASGSSCASVITSPLSDLGNHLGNGVDGLLNGQIRRVRRQRGGVKQKQRGIHVDKNKIDVTPYDNGITGVLTGGVMLGRRQRLNQNEPAAVMAPDFHFPPN